LNGDYEQSHSLNQELVYLRGLFTQVTSISQAEKLIDDCKSWETFQVDWITTQQSMDLKRHSTVNGPYQKKVSGKDIAKKILVNQDPIRV